MAKSTKSYEERMLEMEKKEQESLEKAKRYAAQKKELLKRKKAEVVLCQEKVQIKHAFF